MSSAINVTRRCVVVAALVLAACASPINGPEEGLSVEQRFPITVEPHMEALRVPVNTAGGLDSAGNADVERFVRDYLENGSGSISISASRRNPQASSVITDRLAALGVPRSRIIVGTGDGLDIGDEVRISYIRYQARTEPCGDWSVNLGYTSANKIRPDFGCSTQHNLAAMVADPRDLVSPKPLDPEDPQRRLTVLDKYRKGETTVSEKTKEQSGAVARVGTGGDK